MKNSEKHLICRRHFLFTSGSASLFGTSVNAAPSPRRMAIAFPFGSEAEIRNTHLVTSLLSELSDLGYHEGSTLAVSIIAGNGEHTDYREIAKRATDANPDLIFVNSVELALNVKVTTDAIPMVVCANNAVGNGLIGPHAGNPRNITGVEVSGGGAIYLARLDLLRQTGLKFIRPAFLTPSLFDLRQRVNELRPTWKDLVPVQTEASVNERTLRAAFRIVSEEGADALIVSNSNVLTLYTKEITSLAAEYRIPAVYPYRNYVEAGGLISYGVSFSNVGRAAGRQIDAIFKGAAPGDIPFFQSSEHELAVNLKAAAGLNVTLSDDLVARANLIIR